MVIDVMGAVFANASAAKTQEQYARQQVKSARETWLESLPRYEAESSIPKIKRKAATE